MSPHHTIGKFVLSGQANVSEGPGMITRRDKMLSPGVFLFVFHSGPIGQIVIT